MKKLFNFKHICCFWAFFDLFYILRFSWINITQGRIPLVDDIISFSGLFTQQGIYSLVLFTLSLLLSISVVFTAILLLRKWKNVQWIIYLQTPLRLMFVIPSLSVLPWLFKTLSIRAGAAFLTATLMSEALKIMTLYLTNKTRAGGMPVSKAKGKKDE